MALAYDKTLAIALVTGADPAKYGILIADFSNEYAMGSDKYPSDAVSAYNLLVNYINPINPDNTRTRSHTQGTVATVASTATNATPCTTSGITFTQSASQSGPTSGSDGLTHSDIECYRCRNYGHYASTCPTAGFDTGTTLTQLAIMMTQSAVPAINPAWILLDSQSTMSVFNNSTMLSNVRNSPHTLRALTNGGYQDSTRIGDFKNLGTVWFNPASIANILSLSEVRKVCRVTLDTSAEPALCVHRLDGTLMKFLKHESGLYVYDSTAASNKYSLSVTAYYTMINTVADQKKLFSLRQIASADLARDLYRKLGRPSEAVFHSILTNNQIRNCPVTPDDARRALHIYGPDVATLKGKMTRSAAAPRAPTFEAIPLPAPIASHHCNVTLCADFFFVQGIGFLHTISRGIGFRTVSQVADRSHDTILRELKAVINLYTVRGLTVCDVHADQEFACVREEIRPIAMNISTADTHVGDIERSIRTIKERLRSCVHGLPFRRLPKIMISHMVSDAVRSLNQFPRATGISSTMSPSTIVTGAPTPDYTVMRLEFGTYVQVYEDKAPTNTPRSRSLGAIALNPTGNAQGSYHFMSLATGSRISRHNWTIVPLPDTAIARVEALALHEGRPLIQERGFVVEWRPSFPIDDTIYDLDYAPPAAAPPDHFVPADYDPIDAAELADLDASFDVPVPPAPAQGAFYDVDNEPAQRDDYGQHAPNEEPANYPMDEHFPDEQLIEYDAYEEHPVALEDENTQAPDDAQDGYDQGAPYDDDDDQAAPNHDDYAQGPPPYDSDEQGAPTAGHHNQQVHAHHNLQVPPHAPTNNLRPRVGAGRPSFNDAMDAPHDTKSYFPPHPTCASRRGRHQEAQPGIAPTHGLQLCLRPNCHQPFSNVRESRTSQTWESSRRSPHGRILPARGP
jgi:hypothetical protein